MWHYRKMNGTRSSDRLPNRLQSTATGPEEREDIGGGLGRQIRILSKLELLGSGCNFQRHCHVVSIGLTDKFNDFIQAVHHLQVLQKYPVGIHDYCRPQYDTVVIMRNKWERHRRTTGEHAGDIIRKHNFQGGVEDGSNGEMSHRYEVTGDRYQGDSQ